MNIMKHMPMFIARGILGQRKYVERIMRGIIEANLKSEMTSQEFFENLGLDEARQKQMFDEIDRLYGRQIGSPRDWDDHREGVFKAHEMVLAYIKAYGD